MSSLRELLSEDSEYSKFKQIVRTVRSSLDVESILKEAAFLHSSRSSRTLHAQKLSPQKVQTAILQELSNRARLVELRSLLSRQYELIGTALETIRKHIKVTYHEDLKEIARTATERAQIVDRALSTPIQLKSELSGVFEILDSYIKDIDSASYALRNAVDLLKLILDRRGVESI